MRDPSPKKTISKFNPFSYPVGLKHKLEKPIQNQQKMFLDVLMSRRSSKDFSSIGLSEISQILYLSTKIQSVQLDETGFAITKRPSPSAGARHPIDLLVSPVTKIENRTLMYYNPIDHSLGELMIPSEKLGSFFNSISQNSSIESACIIWFSIQTSKTSSKYINPESLYWKDTGALLYCLQLVSTFLDCKSCPLGTLANSSFDGLFNNKSLVSGGGILIGK